MNTTRAPKRFLSFIVWQTSHPLTATPPIHLGSDVPCRDTTNPLAALHRLRGHERILRVHRTTGQPRIPRQTHRRHQRQTGPVHHLLVRGRALGIHTTMRLKQARALCPEFIQVPARPERYAAVSTNIMHALLDITPDWRYFQWTRRFSTSRAARPTGNKSPEAMGKMIKTLVWDVSGLPCSVGLSGDKTTAKFAGKQQKPGRPDHHSPLGGPRPVEGRPGDGTLRRSTRGLPGSWPNAAR